jgi:hypothetical protein
LGEKAGSSCAAAWLPTNSSPAKANPAARRRTDDEQGGLINVFRKVLLERPTLSISHILD